VAAARLARAAADRAMEQSPDKPRFVAGSIGPLNRMLSMSPRVSDPAYRAVSFDQVRDAYAEQARGLLDGGVDLLLPETVFDTMNLKACVVAIQEVFAERGRSVPVILSVTITDKSGRTLSGQTVEAFYAAVEHVRPLAVGMNCSLGAREIRPHLAELAPLAPCFVSCYPSAGLPNARAASEEKLDTTLALPPQFAEAGLGNLVGGCCDTTDAHIRAVAAAVAGVAPRPVPRHRETNAYPRFSGPEPFSI